ncbi:hypothetical protein [Streptomyces telluris]|uniref:Uncharacterized protein n=1 Tax=Streptomyces telluris TaxID=2720021 RepID=A0A9X2RMN7_9ACTN|nr:hypothetical protein [Streptomyces telluris]MCQ8772063.1 hypothetical protein [Streptomyces telluris]NJP76648.1 hypothetical protein [Streptomyces telluris]
MSVYETLHSTLPEFLGSLAAGLTLATTGWAAAKFRERRALRRPPCPHTPDGHRDEQP